MVLISYVVVILALAAGGLGVLLTARSLTREGCVRPGWR